jgi:hypothetical protein
MPTYHLTGERERAQMALVDEAIEDHKLEDGKGPWNTPSFPLPKKRPGEYRLVQDHRPVNAETLKDGHPLPVNNQIVQRLVKFQMWSVLDLVNGYHQMLLKMEHRHITCMSTPWGTKQSTVQVSAHDGMGDTRHAQCGSICR